MRWIVCTTIDFQRTLTQDANVQACFTLLSLITAFALKKTTWTSQLKGGLISFTLPLKTTCECLFSIPVLNRKDHRLIGSHTGGKRRTRQTLWINTASRQRMMMIRHMGHCHNEWPMPSYKSILNADDELQHIQKHCVYTLAARLCVVDTLGASIFYIYPNFAVVIFSL